METVLRIVRLFNVASVVLCIGAVAVCVNRLAALQVPIIAPVDAVPEVSPEPVPEPPAIPIETPRDVRFDPLWQNA